MEEDGKSPYLAHITEDGRRIQSNIDHLQGVANRAAVYGSEFGAQAEAEKIGQYHDLGKYSQEFQKRIRGQNIQIDHATAGAQVLLAQGDLYGAMAIAGHHGGLPDGGSRFDTAEDSTLFGRTKRKLADYSAYLQELPLPPIVQPPGYVKDGFSATFYTRMIYSCLVDGDYLDTEAFMNNGEVDRGGYAEIPELAARFDAEARKRWNSGDTPLNRERLKIRRYCEKVANHVPGLFNLTIPTGGGKTAASMAFALHHAKAYGKKRIIYVIPYTSIIEQNSDVFAEILGEENVLQHHSHVDFPALEQETLEERKKRLATENWDAPVIMTTAVQFLESLFAAKPSRCRKLHNIANSVVIFDEAQMLPLQFLRPSVAAIAQLVANYGVTAVMCTATQPALDELFREFLPGYEAVELAPPDLEMAVFQRVRYSYLPDADAETILAALREANQVLCIVNTRKRAEEWFHQLPGEGNYHLSTRMTPNHRRKILAEIKERLRKGLPCRLISTSLIEAGVDVDFPIVYREISGIDSIVQAAGRCNREGKPEPGSVYIFRTGEKAPALQEQNISAGESILTKVGLPDHPKAVERYFHKIYRMAGKEGMDRAKHNETILQALQDGIAGCMMPLRTVAARFQIISEDTCTVYIPTGENRELIRRLWEGQRSRSLFRKLGQDAVNVYRTQFQQLYQAGHLKPLGPDMAILLNPEQNYSQQTGVLVEAIGGDSIFH